MIVSYDVPARLGWYQPGLAEWNNGQAWLGYGMKTATYNGPARISWDQPGTAVSCDGPARPGTARHYSAWTGLDRPGFARNGTAQPHWLVLAGLDLGQLDWKDLG
jgi:hypothetical protein